MNLIQRIVKVFSPKAQVAISSKAILIDVRSSGEFKSGHIEGALNLPLDQIGKQITLQIKNLEAEVVVYCLSGIRSGSATRILEQLGYSNVINGGGVRHLALRLHARMIT